MLKGGHAIIRPGASVGNVGEKMNIILRQGKAINLLRLADKLLAQRRIQLVSMGGNAKPLIFRVNALNLIQQLQNMIPFQHDKSSSCF